MTDEEIHQAAAVAELMLRLCQRVGFSTDVIPHGDLAYARALIDWTQKGRPPASVFSYAEGEQECATLMRFRDAITARFGLPILTQDEAKRWRAEMPTVSVEDWGLW